ncbi:MAG: PKD domain-containing protein [Bacteroidales bacterium]|nr:PKD domain-containing protein [Bacteroidales bacterium]
MKSLVSTFVLILCVVVSAFAEEEIDVVITMTENEWNVCTPRIVEFEVKGTFEWDSLLWDFGDGVIKKNGLHRTLVYAKSGVYNLTLSIWKDNVATIIEKEFEVTVYGLPDLKFSVNPLDENMNFQEVVFSPYYDDSYYRLRLPEALENSYSFELVNNTDDSDYENLTYTWYCNRQPLTENTLNITQRGSYNIELHVENDKGCSWSSNKTLAVMNAGEFEYEESCNNEYTMDDEELCTYSFEENDLILSGVESRTCGGEIATAEIKDEGDTIRIAQYIYTVGAVTTCVCPFEYSIRIPDFSRDSCVVLFHGFTIGVNKKMTSVPSLESRNIQLWYSSVNDILTVRSDAVSATSFVVEIYDAQSQCVVKRNIFGTVAEIQAPTTQGVYFARVVENGVVVKTLRFVKF